MKVIFVVGLPRSGTTVFANELKKITTSFYIGESHASSYFGNSSNNSIDKEKFISLVDFVRKRCAFQDNQRHAWEAEVNRVLSNSKKKYTFEDWVCFLKEFGKSCDVECVIDDTPTNYFQLSSNCLNDKDVVWYVVKRDLYDVLSSHLKSPWGERPPCKYLFKYAFFRYRLNDFLCNDRVFIVEYTRIAAFVKDSMENEYVLGGIKTAVSADVSFEYGRRVSASSELLDREWVSSHLSKAGSAFDCDVVSGISKRNEFGLLEHVIIDRVQSAMFEKNKVYRLVVLLLALGISRVFGRIL